MEQPPDQPVDRLRLMLLVRSSIRIECLLTGIDRCMIGLVINEQQRKVRHDLPPGFGVNGICSVIADPAIEPLQNGLVLLDHEEPRPLFGGYSEISGRGGAEVAVVGPVGGGIGLDGWIGVDPTYAYEAQILITGMRFVAQKAFV